MNKDDQNEYLSLSLRRVPRRLIDELYQAKAVTGRPVYELGTEALECWFELIMRPYLRYLDHDNGLRDEDSERAAVPDESLCRADLAGTAPEARAKPAEPLEAVKERAGLWERLLSRIAAISVAGRE